MKFSNLAVLLVALDGAFGPVREEDESMFQEDCAGAGCLTAGVRMWRLKAFRRDVPRPRKKIKKRTRHRRRFYVPVLSLASSSGFLFLSRAILRSSTMLPKT